MGVAEAEVATSKAIKSINLKKELSEEEREKLATVVTDFCQEMCGVELYPYQYEFCWRVIFSLLREDADEITALFSRQAGKTEAVAVTVCGCSVILPLLADALPNDPYISKFKDGLWAGIYAPIYEQAGIMWNRMRTRMYSASAKQTLLDPEIDIDLDGETENMILPNGSFVQCGTASPQAKIEGKTYHLLLLEETQDMLASKIRGSIHPMLAATAGTIVKIGTPSQNKSEFYEACRRNKRHDVSTGLARSKKRLHFEYDYTVAQRYNPRYRKYVEKDKARLGEDSDEFRMKYRLHWLLSRGMFVNPDLFQECGITSTKQPLILEVGKGRKRKKIIFTRSPMVVTNDSKNDHVAAIDVGRENSTVVTVGKPFWDGPVEYGKETRYPTHIVNWLELFGDDHEAQHPQIIAFLKNFKISSAIVDATGKGDPIYSRLAADLELFDIFVMPFVFSESSKDIGYKVFHQEIIAGRITYPAGSGAVRQKKWQKFFNQMCDLEKTWRGQRMVVSKPKDDRQARDDYCDSAMLLCYLVNVAASMEVEDGPNPFIGRSARWLGAEMIKKAGAWYRSTVDPRRSLPRIRPSKNGKWD